MIPVNPEILAPGGDFNSAIHALENGADAVYIGLKNYSARKGAKNFTLEEVRKLKGYCSENNKKIYVAINTLLNNSDIDSLHPTLSDLNSIDIDAIIVQDLGLAKVIRESTGIPIHASTQLAAHNVHGVLFLKSIGFSRVVLSRELSLKEIKEIKSKVPEMEYEIFIHGALCFGFSGLCLASGKLLGRSANKGACGQICRTWFNNKNRKEFSLSLNDLALYEGIEDLKNLGIHSLKIEGRMKGPGYSSLTSKLYKDLLNGKCTENIKDLTKIEFCRNSHKGYIPGKKGGADTNHNYPGHTGLMIGKIVSVNSNSFVAETESDIKNRDGIMILDNQNPPNPIKLSAKIIEKKGKRVTLSGKLPKKCSKNLYQISRHDKFLKEVKPESYKQYKTPLPIIITLNKNSLVITTSEKSFNYTVETEQAKSFIDLNKVYKKIFFAGGDSAFCYPVKVINSSGLKQPFIPQSILKKIRNKFQQEISKDQNSLTSPYVNGDKCVKEKTYNKNNIELSFITDIKNINKKTLPKYGSDYLLPLAPVIFDSEIYLKYLYKFILKNSNDVIIGLNNVGHLGFIDKLPQETRYYCDYGLYNTNNYTKLLYQDIVPNLQWVTKWVEEDNSRQPIFISRTCLKSKEDGCPSGCKMNYKFSLYQKNREFIVIIRDCMTYIFTESTSLS